MRAFLLAYNMKPGIQFWIIAVLTIVIVYLILSRPAPYDSNKQAYTDTLTFLRAKEASIVAQGKRIIEAHRSKTKKDSLAINAKDEQIRQAKAKVVIRRVYIQPLVDSIPELRSFIQGQDSVILIQGQQIDTLKQAYASQIQTTKDLIQNHDAQARISQRIEAEKDKRISDLEKQVRKTRRGSKLAKVLLPIVGLGAFILGGL